MKDKQNKTVDPILQAFTDRVMDEAPAMRAAWAELDIEWHCEGRHGVVRHVPREDAGYVQRVIDWHMGHNSCRWADEAPRIKAVEFVAMTKVYPPPKKPWEWCGETVLFKDWKADEDRVREAAEAFTPGQAVWFEYNGERKEGFISKINRQTIGVTVPGEGGWKIPPTQLNATNGA